MRWTEIERLAGDRAALRYAAVLYAVGTALHTADHLRRGSDVLTTTSRILGASLTIAAFISVGFVLTKHRLAPLVIVAVAFPHAFWITAGHLLPRWNSFSDAFPSAPLANGVTGISWATALLELAGAVAIGLVGARVLIRMRGNANRVLVPE